MVIPTPLADAEPDPDIRSHNHNGYPSQLHSTRPNGDNGIGNSVGNDGVAAGQQQQQLPGFALNTPPLRPRPATISTLSDVDAPELHHKAPIDDAWEEPTYWQGFKNMIRSVPVLVTVPILCPTAWALHFSHQNPVAVFVVSLLSIVPLAGGLGFATEELATRVGDAWGGLLNATFGNAVELLIAILALVKGDIDIVQASMAGSILSNILLVLGMSYFAGGLRFHEQLYAVVGAQTHISLLGISIAAILLPEAFHLAFPATEAGERAGIHNRATAGELSPEELKTILSMSRGLSFMLLAVYGMYLTFQLWTHAYLFKINRDEEKADHDELPEPDHARVFPKPHWVPSLRTVMSRDTYHAGAPGSRRPTPSPSPQHPPLVRVPTTDADGDISVGFSTHNRLPSHVDLDAAARTRSHSVTSYLAASSPTDVRFREKRPSGDATGTAVSSPSDIVVPPLAFSSDSDVERGQQFVQAQRTRKRRLMPHAQPRAPMYMAFASLVVFTGLAGLTAECLVDSIDGLTEHTNVSREFIGMIVLPVVGNAVEHITAVTVSLKDRLNLSLSIAVGSSIQVSLCLLPLLVLVGWMIGQPMSLLFDTYETICLVLACLLVQFAISDGRTNYLEGFVLMMAFFAMALVTWYYDPLH